MEKASTVLSRLVGPKTDADQPLSDDAQQALREGLSRATEEEEDPGLPLGYEGIEVVEP